MPSIFPENFFPENFADRMRAAIYLAWDIFSKKVGSGLIHINKEASMQLQYAYILKQLLPLITFHQNEFFEIELETGVSLHDRSREIDLLFKGKQQDQNYSIAIEMKCYRTRAASGGLRGATDIFMKDVYEDFYLLEQYVLHHIAHEGIALVMNDMERLISPKQKEAKCWDYDISHEKRIYPIHLTTSVGGKEVNIMLTKLYTINWVRSGQFWFLAVQAQDS